MPISLNEARLHIDKPVTYTAFTGSRHERGIITDVCDDHVLVRMDFTNYSRAVSTHDLALIVPDAACVQTQTAHGAGKSTTTTTTAQPKEQCHATGTAHR